MLEHLKSQYQNKRRVEIQLSDEWSWDDDQHWMMFDRWSDRNFPDDERFDSDWIVG